MRYRLSLTIRYEFDRSIGAARQMLRICPADLPGLQQVASSRVLVHPAPQERREFTDFFGTRTIELALPAGLTELRFDMSAEVTRFAIWDQLDLSAPLSDLPAEIASHTSLDAEAPHHFLPSSPRIPFVPDIASFAARATAGEPTARAAVQALGQALHDEMKFDAKATEVDTSVADAFAGGSGVCQDFSQIMIAGLRSIGIPAAYVSGFLRTLPPPGKKRLKGADAMHAWVRAWTGTRGGWVEYDPTNACFVAEDHVTIGHGRDYGDAAPVIGALRLNGDQTGSHSVDLDEL